ncbi:MAG: CvpA family protein [Saprospiraceae bacterium]|nr:CvpA family protein [Saprospiraceae bacterium]
MAIDIIFLAVFAYGFWVGYSRGIIGTVFNFAAYIFGFVLAFKITPTTTNILEALFHSDNPSMFLAAFIVNLVFIMFVLRQAAKGMESAFQALYLGVINQTLGGALMAGVGIVIYSILIWFLVQVRFLNDLTLSESKSYPFLKDLPGKAKSIAIRAKPFAEDIWGYSMNWMDRLEQYGVQKTATKPNIYKVPDDGKAIEDDGPESVPTTTTTSPAPVEDSDGIEE